MKILHSLISSQLDADRIDYILRDCYSSGLEFGRLDVFRLVSNLTIFKGRLVFRGRALSALEATLVDRLWLYKHLVYHHTVKVTNYMMQSCIWYAIKNPPSKGPAPLSLADFHFRNYLRTDGTFFDDPDLISKLVSYYQTKREESRFDYFQRQFFSVYSRTNMPVALWKNDSDYISLNTAFNNLIDDQIQPAVLAVASQKGVENEAHTRRMIDKLRAGDWLKELKVTWKADEKFEDAARDRILQAVGRIKELSEVSKVLRPEDVLVISGGVIPYDPLTEEDSGIFILNAGDQMVSILKASNLINAITRNADPPLTNIYLHVPVELKDTLKNHIRELSNQIPEQFLKELSYLIRARAGQ